MIAWVPSAEARPAWVLMNQIPPRGRGVAGRISTYRSSGMLVGTSLKKAARISLVTGEAEMAAKRSLGWS